MIQFIKIIFKIFLLSSFFQNAVDAQPELEAIPYGDNKEAGHYITLIGARQYFEVYGKGTPLVLIHGNGGDIAYMKPQIKYFSRKYKVIVMDCRGRGKSELGKDSLTYMQMTDDIAGILEYLHVDSTYVVGRSDGGIISLLLAIYHPDKIKKIVAFAANLTPDTLSLYPYFYNEVIKERKQADEMLLKKDTTQNWRVIQQRNRLMEFQPHITAGDLRKIKCPVLVMSTDRDIIREEHTLFIYNNIERANLCFLPGVSHYVSKDQPELFNYMVNKFLEEPYKRRELRE